MKDPEARTVKPKTRRPLLFVLLGLLIFGVAGFLIKDHLQTQPAIAPAPKAYEYTIQQGETNQVHYRQSSFFNGLPGPADTAYIANMTDYINAWFRYDFEASQPTDLSYQYGATAVVQGTYGSAASDAGVSNVWSKQFQLLAPVSGSQHSKSLLINQVVKIPFTDYKTTINQFKAAVNAPLNSQLVVTYKVRVSGKANGTPFSDEKISTVTAPLDQLVYKLAVKYTKADSHKIVSAQSRRLQDIVIKYEMPVGVALVVLGLASIIYGFRRQILKSPYQRKLERIYRYYDGIIIHARQLTDLANKNIVMVKSFDDLLNLEEELNTPIIASEVSGLTTHFLITRDDVVYVYTLGEPVPFKPPAAPAEAQRQRQNPKRPPARRKMMG